MLAFLLWYHIKHNRSPLAYSTHIFGPSNRVMASQASVPLVYIPLEAIFDKYYGQSERNLSQLLTACEGLDGCIIFLDELDSLATARYG